MTSLIKYFALLFILLNGQNAYSQKQNDYILISESAIKKAETIHDLLPDLPKTCKVAAFDLTIVTGSVPHIFSNNKSTLDQELRDQIGKLTKGNKLIIQYISASCVCDLKKKYVIKVQ